MELLYEQVRTFLGMSLYGFLAGLLFHIYQYLINKFRLKKYILHIFDFLFIFLLAIFAFIFLLYINEGSFRFYVILAILLGILLYNILRKVLTSD
ncbi:spore cortex biosynthesis protein YabQ [Natronospora cellulosivora (SeqCode)]